MIASFTSKQWGVVRTARSTYMDEDDPLAVFLLNEDGTMLAKLSINMTRPECSQDSRALPPDCFYLKTWAENEELAVEALEAGLFVLRPDLPSSSSGWVEAPAAQLIRENFHGHL
jgi:hypothetical protein